MNRKSYVINFHWQEPETGSAAFVANLSDEEADKVQDAIEFINSHDDSGYTVAEFSIERAEGVLGGKSYEETIADLTLNSRYEEEGIYDKKCALLGSPPVALSCSKCGGMNVQIAMWVNPNTKKIMSDEPVFDVNQAPSSVGVQWCEDCDDHTDLTEGD